MSIGIIELLVVLALIGGFVVAGVVLAVFLVRQSREGAGRDRQ